MQARANDVGKVRPSRRSRSLPEIELLERLRASESFWQPSRLAPPEATCVRNDSRESDTNTEPSPATALDCAIELAAAAIALHWRLRDRS